MWQQIVVGVLVLAAALYALKLLAPRTWRKRFGSGESTTEPPAKGERACGNGKDGCH